jgi:hypothetical protein
MSGSQAIVRRSWPRLVVVHALQLPALGLLGFGVGAAVPWVAGIWGSLVCCAGTDSRWRWWNRLLLAEAVAWLTVALVLGT